MGKTIQRGLKRLASLTLFLVIMAMAAGCSTSAQPVYVPGIYENEGVGYYSTLKVRVSVDAYRIESIDILYHEEPEILAKIVFKELPERIIKENSAEVDIVSGATYTSRALLEAVSKALEEAKVESNEAAD